MRQLLPEPRADLDDAALQRIYARPDIGAGAAHLRVNFVATPDGAISLDGVSAPLSAPADKALFALLRTLTDVVLVGAGTVRAEGYGAVRDSEVRRGLRGRLGLPPTPPIAVVTQGLALDLASPFFRGAPARPLVFTTEAAPAELRAAAAEVADVVVAGKRTVDVTSVVTALRDRGLRQILCEGGPRLFSELLRADLVDELCLTVAPLLAGGGQRRLTGDELLAAPLRFGIGTLLEADDGFLFLRYLRRR